MITHSAQLPLLLHIPHAGTTIPTKEMSEFTDLEAVNSEMNRLTDWFTDELFSVEGGVVCSTPYSRLLVDLERFTDDKQEPKARVGQGVIYEFDSCGNRFRDKPTQEERQRLLDTYYYPHHRALEDAIAQTLENTGSVVLIDGHSFPAAPLMNDNDFGRPRPDICIGTCSNTSSTLVEHVERACHANGWTTALNFPYEGCLVPTMYAGDARVSAVMIEVNRALYLEQSESCNQPRKSADFDLVKRAIQTLVLELALTRV